MTLKNNNEKKHNGTFLVTELLLTEGPQSQASISRKTGLSPAMVNYVVKQLRERGSADIHWVNGREAIVSLTSKTGKFISVLISTDRMSGTLFLFDTEKKIEFDYHIDPDTPEDNNPETLVSIVLPVIADAGLTMNDISGIAISIVAPLDTECETIISWSAGRLPGWCDIKIKTFFEDALGVPVIVGNDANHATLAEWTWGSGRGVASFVYIACSKQIGGGIIIDNHVYKGGNGMAAEFGHLVIDSAGPLCFCGCRGCLTTFISERAIIINLSTQDDYKESLLEIINAAIEGDSACQNVLSEAGRNLGKAMANIVKILAPGVVTIGGQLSAAGALFFDSVAETIEEHNQGPASPPIVLTLASITHRPEILGGLAALLSLKNQPMNILPDWINAL